MHLRLLTLPCRSVCFSPKNKGTKEPCRWPIHMVRLEVKCQYHKHPPSITGPYDRISSLLISLHATQWAYPADYILAEMPEQSAECLSWVDSAEGDQTSQTLLAVILPSSSLSSPNSTWQSKVSNSNLVCPNTGGCCVRLFFLLGVEAWKPWVAALTAACEAAAEHLRALGEKFGFVVMSLSLEATGFLNDSQDLGSTGAKESRRGETLSSGVSWKEHATAKKHSYIQKKMLDSFFDSNWTDIFDFWQVMINRDCGLRVYDIIHHRLILDEAVYLFQDMTHQTSLPSLLISSRPFGMLLVPSHRSFKSQGIWTISKRRKCNSSRRYKSLYLQRIFNSITYK